MQRTAVHKEFPDSMLAGGSACLKVQAFCVEFRITLCGCGFRAIAQSADDVRFEFQGLCQASEFTASRAGTWD